MMRTKMTKIRALLAKAEDAAATPAEAQAFSAKAFELMAQYGIEMAMIEAHGDADKAKKLRPQVRNVEVTSPRARDGVSLMAAIAVSLRCRVVLRRWDTATKNLTLIGFASDLDRVDTLYRSLSVQMHTGLASVDVPYGQSVRAFRNSWALGFISVVGRRLNEAEQQAARDADVSKGSTGSTALVLADRSAQVDQTLKEEFPNLRPAQTRRSSGHGYTAGWEAGLRADLGHDRPGRRHSLSR